MGTDCGDFPVGLRSLKLSHCAINEEFLESWFKILGVSLESLHLNHLRNQHSDPSSVNIWKWFRRVRNLTASGMTRGLMGMNMFNETISNWSQLESLTLNLDRTCSHRVTVLHVPTENLRYLNLECKDNLNVAGCFQLLDHLTIKCSEEAWDVIDIPNSLKTLEYRNLPKKINKFLTFNNVEHFKIHCNWYHEEELRSHFESLPSIKSCQITSSPPTPGYNLSSSSMNEDCLRTILSYLPLPDVMSLGVASPELLSFMNPNDDLLKIDEKFLIDYPIADLPEFYDNLGRCTKQLHVDGIKDIHLNEIIGKFCNLRRLELKKMILRVHQTTTKIAKVEELSIDDCQLTMKYREALYRQVKDTLSSLHMDYKVHHLSLLHNLKVLSLRDLSISPNELVDFLKVNKNLRQLSIDSYFYDLSPFIEHLNPEFLKEFKLQSYKIDYSRLGPFFERFRNLESLELVAKKIHVDVFLDVDLPRLASLVIVCLRRPMDTSTLEPLKKLTNLKRLQIEAYSHDFPATFEIEVENILKPLGLSHVSSLVKYGSQSSCSLRSYIRLFIT